MLGIGVHTFIDGAVYSITFTVSLFTGVLAASVTTPLGMLVSYPYMSRIDP